MLGGVIVVKASMLIAIIINTTVLILMLKEGNVIDGGTFTDKRKRINPQQVAMLVSIILLVIGVMDGCGIGKPSWIELVKEEGRLGRECFVIFTVHKNNKAIEDRLAIKSIMLRTGENQDMMGKHYPKRQREWIKKRNARMKELGYTTAADMHSIYNGEEWRDLLKGER